MSDKSILSKKSGVPFKNSENLSKDKAGKNKNQLFQKINKKHHHKKQHPFHAKKEHWNQNKPSKKANDKGKQLPTPHNTTQFICDAVCCPSDPHIYECDTDRFDHDFQHHAMAGSMMDLMQQKIRRDSLEYIDLPEEVPPVKENNETENHEKTPENQNHHEIIENATPHSDDSTNKPFEQYLKEAENSEDALNAIKHLVDVIKRKDSQIDSLLSLGDRKDSKHEDENL